MKRLLLVLCLMLACSSCASIGVKATSTVINEVSAAGANFDKQMTNFMENWPYLSGVLEGYFYNRTGDVSLAMREAREKLDALKPGPDGKWEKRDLGLAFGYSVNLFNLAVKEWMSKLAPGLLKFIPVIA